jgi:signal transduction histidine kinase
MTNRSHKRTLLLFGALSVYIVLQFTWWAVLLLRKDREALQLALEVQALGGPIVDHPDPDRGLRMIVGEASVFFAFLLGILFLTFRAVKRDLALVRTQQNFLLAVTHELRTPIAAIKLQLQTLARTGLTQEQRDDLRLKALTESDRLALLADKVLLATKADDGLLALELADMDVARAMQDVLERARVHVARNHPLKYEGPGSLMIRSDEQVLRSIADNLVENAAKYSPEGRPITLTVESGANGWRLLVSDEGPGIPGHEQQRIFEKFYRSGNEETRSAKGTGLGLYIVQRLVQRLGGVIQVRNAAEHGAIFVASFPKH